MAASQTVERVGRWIGTGSVSREGRTLCTARYVIDVYQEFLHVKSQGADAEETLEGVKSLVVSLHGHQVDTLNVHGQTVTLRLEDGRQLDGYLDYGVFTVTGEIGQF